MSARPSLGQSRPAVLWIDASVTYAPSAISIRTWSHRSGEDAALRRVVVAHRQPAVAADVTRLVEREDQGRVRSGALPPLQPRPRGD